MGDRQVSESSGGPPAKSRRARIACLQCRSRRTRCDADPPRSCSYCIENAIDCRWPPREAVKKRGRKVSHLPVSTPNSQVTRQSQGQAPIDSPLDWWSSFTTDGAQLPNGESESSRHAQSHSPRFEATTIDASHPPASATPLSSLLAQYDALLPSKTLEASWMGDLLGAGEYGTASITHPPGPRLAQPLPPFSPHLPFEATNDTFSWMTSPNGDPANHVYHVPPESEARSPDPRAQPGLSDASYHGEQSSRKLGTVRWTRPHAGTAVCPGLEQVTCRVLLTSPCPHSPLRPDLDQSLMPHLIDLFFVHHGCLFPALTVRRAYALLQGSKGRSSFLLDSVAAISAKFATDDDRHVPQRSRHEISESFRMEAMSKVGMMVGVPAWETILALALLAWSAIGVGSSIEAWMMIGMATRMCQDMGLHQCRPVDPEDTTARAERLVFWSVLFTEYLICLAEGRRPSLPPSSVTQQLPTEEECVPEARPGDASLANAPRHPFPFVVRAIHQAGPLIDRVNAEADTSVDAQAEVSRVSEQMDRWYADLHVDIAWNAANLQLHHSAGQGPAYLFLHIFSHAVQSLRFMLDERHGFVDFSPSGVVGSRDAVVSFPRWLHSPRFIGDMLVLGNLIDPKMVLVVPFFGQCLYLAGKSFVQDKRVRQALSDRSDSLMDEGRKKHEMFRKLADHNIGLFRQALLKLSSYWQGSRAVHKALERCVNDEDADMITAVALNDNHTSSPAGPHMRTEEILYLRGLTDVDIPYLPAASPELFEDDVLGMHDRSGPPIAIPDEMPDGPTNL